MRNKIEQLCNQFAITNYYSIYYSQHAYQYSEKVQNIERSAKRTILQYWFNQTTLKKMGYLWLRNTWKNLAHNNVVSLSHPLKKIEENNTLSKIDAIIVGAGPSLDEEQLSYLQDLQKKVCIITVDSALPILQSHNITPDFCIILESQWYNMFDFLPKPSSSTIAIADISAYPSSLQDFHHKYFVSSYFAPLSFFIQYKDTLPISIPALGSVGLMALYIAYMISFKRIFLMGMDFSYYVGKTHANHSASHTQWLLDHAKTAQFSSIGTQLENPTLKRINEDAHRVSDAVLQRYANDFDELIQYVSKEKDIEIYDLNVRYSLLRNAKKTSLEQFQYYVHHNVANKYKERRLNFFRIHTKQDVKCQESKKIVIQEQEKYKKLLERISILEKEETLPNKEDWDILGLDACTYSLFFNTYFLRTSYNYWKENAISNHIRIMIHRSLRDLEKIISQTTALTDTA